MSTPQIDTRAAIEQALDEFNIFLQAGMLVWSIPPVDRSAVITLEFVIEEFNKLKSAVLSA